MNKSLGFGSKNGSGFEGIDNTDVHDNVCVDGSIDGTDDEMTSELVLVLMESGLTVVSSFKRCERAPPSLGITTLELEFVLVVVTVCPFQADAERVIRRGEPIFIGIPVIIPALSSFGGVDDGDGWGGSSCNFTVAIVASKDENCFCCC